MASEIPERFEREIIDGILNLEGIDFRHGISFVSLRNSLSNDADGLRGMPCPISATPVDNPEISRWTCLRVDDEGVVTLVLGGGRYGDVSVSGSNRTDNGEAAYDPNASDKTLDEYVASWDALIREVRDGTD